MLNELFHALNSDKRPKHMPDYLQDFMYINGGLFGETLPTIYFDGEMRQKLLHIAQDINWGHISPEIFGSLFQEAMDINERRELGAHYTEKENIEKVINALFLNDLKAEFAQIGSLKRDKKRKLVELQQKIATLKFLDPACGTGNFLVAAYKALRELEIEIIQEYNRLEKSPLQSGVSIEQFYGIELDGLAREIAVLSMWLIDHLCNLDEGAKLGKGYGSLNIPLKKSAHILHGNALRCDWESVDYILGNPPFVGKTYQTAEQKADTALICHEIKLSGSLDYVANWHVKAAQYLQHNPHTRVAFVSTNSITQGEQVPVLFNYLFGKGVHIHFAYRTFAWTSQAAGKAAVHCVIIGFGLANIADKYLIDGEKVAKVHNINGYLIEADNAAVEKRKNQISGENEMVKGSQPTDGGHLILSLEEKNDLIQREPLTEKYIRPFLGSEEFLNDKQRFCLWFRGVDLQVLANDLKKMPSVAKRIELVKQMRLESKKEATQKWAEKPHLFTEIRQPESGNYLAMPEVSSENREFIPIGFLDSETVVSNKIYTLPNATLYHFAILSSTMHNAFMRTVAGRMKSDYSYSNTIVYNNFPFPMSAQVREQVYPHPNPPPQVGEGTKVRHNTVSGSLQSAPSPACGGGLGWGQKIAKLEQLAQAILDVRQKYRDNAIAKGLTPPSLAELYNPRVGLDPFPELRKAHRDLDKAVDTLYRDEPFENEAERVAFLFEMYGKMK
ncbi:MAG: N-6 DNA methylase [Alysiella sp.]|nr:DNA methyltransferase [Alysiella sp.]MDO4433788.1 N-6 DNA methylase [Alysiella sp.]